MKLIAYLRVSTVGQAKDGFGLDVQEKLIRAWARSEGHKLVRVESDNGKSGTLPDTERPGLLAALKAVEHREAQGIVVSSLDRLARLLHVQEAILARVWQQDGCMFTVDAGEILADDPDDPMRKAMRQMMGVFAELDRALVIKKMRNGRKEKAAKGSYVGGKPGYGLRVEGHKLVCHEGEQQVIARIRADREAGASYRVIANALNEEGIPPKYGKQWHAITVSRVIEGSTDAPPQS